MVDSIRLVQGAKHRQSMAMARIGNAVEFDGQDGKSPYSAKSVQNLVKSAARKANIHRRVTPHVLRHCFATHLLDAGTDVRYIQELLGHKDIKTILIYTHVTTKSMENIKSPLDQLNLWKSDQNAKL